MATKAAEFGTIKAPPLYLAAMEVARSSFECSTLFLSSALLAQEPRGDGHPVMVLPGFATDDNATLLLRGFLESLGYEVHPWRLGWNLDHRTVGENGEHVARRIDEIRGKSGRKLSLIGWSLGGVIAREAARQDPQAVRQVISLGSPFGGNPRATNANTIYERLTGNRIDAPATIARYANGNRPLDVPSTAIYSKTDGLTAWENCVSLPDPQSENIEVHASHFGLVVNPMVFHVIADRLALPEGGWRPFHRGGVRALFYPAPDQD